MSGLTYQVREYPLEVECTTDGQYFSKGWQERELFVSDANYEAELDDCCGGYRPEDVRYEVWRCVPAGPDDPCYVWFFPAALGTPGAFPVTVVGG